MTSYNDCQRYAVSGNDFLFQQDSAPAHCAEHVLQLNCCAKKAKLSCVQTEASKQPRSQSCGLRDLDYGSCHAASCLPDYHRQIHSVNELKRRLINAWCGLIQSIFDETSDQWRSRSEEDIERVSMLKDRGHLEYSLWTDNVDFVHIGYVTFNVTCLTVTPLITKSCQQCWPIHSCSFYKVLAVLQ